ncbi:hypothetical protein AKJ16_DCAP06959 [Drosera capensis]
MSSKLRLGSKKALIMLLFPGSAVESPNTMIVGVGPSIGDCPCTPCINTKKTSERTTLVLDFIFFGVPILRASMEKTRSLLQFDPRFEMETIMSAPSRSPRGSIRYCFIFRLQNVEDYFDLQFQLQFQFQVHERVETVGRIPTPKVLTSFDCSDLRFPRTYASPSPPSPPGTPLLLSRYRYNDLIGYYSLSKY